MANGFILTKLILTGQSVKPAIINFKGGLNVITGPTNTGKSFIYECIDYMMGGSKLDRIVAEAAQYDLINLEIQSGNLFYTLERSMKGGDFKLYNSSYESRVNTEPEKLSAKHDKNSDKTVSRFLLSLNNLDKKEIRKNDKGVKRTLSYRDITRLLLVSENDIIKKESPILTNNIINKTAETNTIKLLITGIDDSSIIAKEDKKTITSRKGKIELLNELIKEIDVNPDIDSSILNSEIEGINQQIVEAKESQKVLLQAFSIKNEQRKEISKRIFDDENKLTQINETLSRSELLREHYATDIKRLASTIEAGMALASNPQSSDTCPYCTSQMITLPGNDHIENTISSCKSEIEKIENLILELNIVDQNIKNDKGALKNEIEKNSTIFNELELEINKDVAAKINEKTTQLESANETKIKLFESKYKITSARKFSDRITTISNSSDNSSNVGSYDKISTAIMQPVCDVVAKILKECHYDNIGTVSFSEDTLDLVIGNQNRNLVGKGLRAITYAVLVIALTEYIKEKAYSVSIPVFDSPLVTYSKPKSDNEGISHDLAMDFYRYCANATTCEQIIVLENEEPPEDILSKINHIVFTGIVGDINKGFIPLKN